MNSDAANNYVMYDYTSLLLFFFLFFLPLNITRANYNNTANSHDYAHALSLSILFYEGQRSGKLPSNQSPDVAWRGDSALQDGHLANIDLTGGYYDAGDNVKFVFPMAFTITILSWVAIHYESHLVSAIELQNLQTAIRWGTDFLLKAHTAPAQLYTQVGDGNSDHRCWERPEDMDTPRTLIQINASDPGTEAAAEAASALAAASIVFSTSDSEYSKSLLNSAELLFSFADGYKSSYTKSCPFYCSFSGYNDELLWAASWLYKATRADFYRTYVVNNLGMSNTINEFSWDNKFAGLQVLLTEEYFEGEASFENYHKQSEYFICANMPGHSGTQIKTTKGGLLFIRDDNNAQYAMNAAYLITVYADYLEKSSNPLISCNGVTFYSEDLHVFAKSQINYMLGSNPLNMSYMVGFGDKYPERVHHRGASIASIYIHPEKVGCSEGYAEWYNKDAPNPNVHMGAIVGGPNQNDAFQDTRSDYNHLEPTTYTNAPVVGLLATNLIYL